MVKVSPVRPVKTFQWAVTHILAGIMLLLGVVLAAAFYIKVSPAALGNLLWILPLFGAVTNTAVAAVAGGGSNLRTCDITATADADATTGNIAHGFGFTPDYVEITPILAPGGLKAWAWDRANTDGTNIVFLGNNVVGSGNAGAQLRVVFGRRHSMIR